MNVIRGRVLRIYPNKEQIEKIENNFGACRFIYNHFLDIYLKNREPINLYSAYKEIAAIKNEKKYDWLIKADSVSLRESVKNLQNAITRYEKRLSGKPKRKRKKNDKHSYRTVCNNGNIKFKDGMLRLPKLGAVKFSGYDTLTCKILSATIKREDGMYYCSLCTAEDIAQKENLGGEYELRKIYIPEHLTEPIFSIECGDKDRDDENKMNDYLHKVSTNICRENKKICIKEYEDQILPESYYNKLIRMIEYKSAVYNNDIIRA